jgi:hypothetical protein
MGVLCYDRWLTFERPSGVLEEEKPTIINLEKIKYR